MMRPANLFMISLRLPRVSDGGKHEAGRMRTVWSGPHVLHRMRCGKVGIARFCCVAVPVRGAGARARADGKTVPSGAVTADAYLDERARILASGMTDYLAKPVQPDQLLAVLQQVLQ